MSEPNVVIPLSLAIDLYYDSLDLMDTHRECRGEAKYLQQAATLLMEIQRVQRNAALDQLTQQDQDRYKDTVNPLKRADNG